MNVTASRVFPPGPSNSRRVLLDIQKDSLAFLCNLRREYGGIVHYMHGPAHVFLMNDPDLTRAVLVEQNDKMDRPPMAQNTLGKFLGQGLLVTAGETHRTQRQSLQPMFTPAAVAIYAQNMVKCSQEMLQGWQEGQTRDIYQDMQNLTMDIVYRTIFGAQTSEAHSEARSAIRTLQRYSGESLKRAPTITEQECQTAIRDLDAAIGELIVQHRMAERIPGDEDLLFLLMECFESDQQTRDQALTFFVAGQESSASSLAWTWYLLASHLDIQRGVRDEIEHVIGVRPVTAEDQNSLNLTVRVIKESLRLYPPAWLIGRTPFEPIHIGSYLIEPGDSIAISPYVLHRDPALFSDPERFDPERFLREPAKYTYLPFGAGPHVCIGQHFAMLEMTLILTTIFQQFEMELVPGQNITPEPLLTLCPRNGLRVIPHRQSGRNRS